MPHLRKLLVEAKMGIKHVTDRGPVAKRLWPYAAVHFNRQRLCRYVGILKTLARMDRPAVESYVPEFYSYLLATSTKANHLMFKHIYWYQYLLVGLQQENRFYVLAKCFSPVIPLIDINLHLQWPTPYSFGYQIALWK